MKSFFNKFRAWIIGIIFGGVILAAGSQLIDNQLEPTPTPTPTPIIEITPSPTPVITPTPIPTEIPLETQSLPVLIERGEKFNKYSLGNNQYSIDASIAPINYLESGVWQEIDTNFINSDLGGYSDKVEKTPFKFHSSDNGKRRLYPRRSVATEYIEFGIPQYWNGVSWQTLNLPTKIRNGNTLIWDTANYTIKVFAYNSQVGIEVVLKNSLAAKRIRWPISLTGLTLTNWYLASNSDGVIVAYLNQPKVISDGAGLLRPPREVSYILDGGYVEMSADITGLVFPITIDPTIDVQVGVTGDDGLVYGANLYNDLNYFIAGQAGGGAICNSWMRFPSLSGLAGATITVSNVQIQWGGVSGSGWLTKLMADDQQAAVAPVDYAEDYNGRTPTTAQVDWDPATWAVGNWYTSPSLNTVIQELVDSYGANLSVIQILWKDDGSPANSYVASVDYTLSSALAPKLHIEYTAGAGGVPARRENKIIE